MTAPDVRLEAQMIDVRCKPGVSTCEGGPLSDYTGELRVAATVRITDKHNASTSGGTGDGATVADGAYLRFPLACTPDPSGGSPGAIGATCRTVTSANALIPGAILAGKRGNWELQNVEVLDGGPDGDADTANNTLFATQGVFVP
jgi:hypothetical protein